MCKRIEMDSLLTELEGMKLTGNFRSDNLWISIIKLLEATMVPVQNIGKERPCEEKDYREYRQIVDRNLTNVESALRHVLSTINEHGNRDTLFENEYAKGFLVKLIIVIGEQRERSVWNTAESVAVSENLATLMCHLTRCESVSKILIDGRGSAENSLFDTLLITLRPKLLKDTWKTYPAAVLCYKWLLSEIEVPNLIYHMNTVIPTALIILDDYVVENRLAGIKCVEKILQHGYMRKELVDTGYSEVLYDALKRLLILREVAYVLPLYSCIASLLSTTEYYNDTNSLEWTRRDDVLASLLGNMECEQNLDLRHAYMASLPGLLTNIGCAKWCQRLARILSEYCAHHTDLKTLKVTTETAKKFLVTFQPRVPTHCVSLYAAFLKLHMDLMETPVFDNEIILNLEDCISLLYKLTPTIGNKIIGDERMKSVVHRQLQFKILNDNTYFE